MLNNSPIPPPPPPPGSIFQRGDNSVIPVDKSTRLKFYSPKPPTKQPHQTHFLQKEQTK